MTVNCASGGAANFDGHVHVVPVPVMVDVNVAIDFDRCTTADGTTMAGNVEFVQSVAAAALGAPTPEQVETRYQGHVQCTGKLNASCPVDVHVLVDETGRAVQVSGMFCGQDASQLNLQIKPSWVAAN
jgi:hypothetical protein